jgi:hypothetical protein
MKRISSVLALALAALLPIGAQASELSYTWIEADYVDAGDNADGFGIRGQLQFGESGFYGLAGYTDIDIDTPLADLDAQAWEAGVGYALGVATRTDLIGEIAYQDFDLGLDAVRASVGARHGFTQNLEGLVKANYRDLDCDIPGCEGDDVTGTLGLTYKFNPTWAINGEVELVDNDDAWLVGVRAQF